MKHISNFDNFTKSLNESTLDFLIGVMLFKLFWCKQPRMI